MPVSDSKLGIHLIGRYTEGARRVVLAGPRAIKVLDPQAIGDMQRAVLEYKSLYPEGTVVMRVWERTPGLRYRLSDDPERCADHFWDRVLRPAVEALPPAVRRRVDFLEGPNEGENTPTWEGVEAAAWFGRFWTRLALLIARSGMRPCVGSIAVGNPPGTPAEIREKFGAFLPAIEAAKRFGGAWSYHAYSLEYTTDPKVEIWFSLRYRLLLGIVKSLRPDLLSVPIILTEGGIDRRGNPKTDGWRARGSVKKFEAWLAWFDSELRKDPQVLAVTLFQIGDPRGWPSFDLEPVADWLARHIASLRPERKEGVKGRTRTL